MSLSIFPKSFVLEKKYMSWLVLASCLILTFSISFYLLKRNTIIKEQVFNNQFGHIKNQTTKRMEDHARILQSGAALFNASDKLTREEWHAFAYHLNLDKLLPGIIGFGLTVVIPPKNLASHIRKIRLEGFPNYKVKPEGVRNFYTSIVFLEPFSGRNLQYFGYDMYSDPILRSAMDKSRDMNVPVLSGKVSLLNNITGSEKQLEAVMFVPVYRKDLPLDSIEQRRIAIYGWVYSPYKMKDLFLGIQSDPNSISNYYRHLQVFDSEEISTRNLLYEDIFKGDSQKLLSTKNFIRRAEMNFFGQKWTIYYTQIYDDLFSMENKNIWIIFLIGTLISFLLFMLVYNLQEARHEALDLAKHLMESEERLIFATETSGIGVWELDLVDHSVVRSLEHDKIFGYSELLPKWTYEIFLEHVLEEDRAMVNQRFLQALETQDKWSFECRIKRVDKAIRWIWANGRHTKKLTKKAKRIAGIVQDITERKKSEEEHATLAAIVTHSSDAIISMDLNGVIKSWNLGAQYLFGYSSDEVINHSIAILIPQNRQGEEQEILKRLRERHRIEHFETVRLSKDKRLVDVSISSSPITNNQGEIIGVSKILRNITELKKAEHELYLANIELLQAKAAADLANAAKSSFLSNMSHEIRTPMNAIIGMANLLSETKLDDQQLRYVDVFKKAGFNLLHIINDILDMSKIESGKFTIENSDFQPRIIIQEIIEILKIKAQEKNLDLTFNVSLDTPERLLGDAFRIKQTLTNLIGNSVKFTNSGTIHVEVSKNYNSTKKGNLFFSVTDSGIGIKKEVQDKLFHSYTQANSSTTKLYGGTGLGLAISKKLVELMGGEIWLESEEGHGTKIFFTISCKEIKNKKMVQETLDVNENPNPNNNSHHLKILLVDDSEFNRFLIKEYLKVGEHVVIEAENGEVALDKAKNEQFDIILMDIQMPVMDGYTATKEIREWEKKSNQRHTPIVAITAYALREEEEKSIAVGCDQHLSKPIMKESLLEAIASLTN